MDEMKSLMDRQGLTMQNRLIRFTTDSVEVYLESYRGIDKIRIIAEAKKAGLTGDAAFDLPIIDSKSYTIHGDRAGAWLDSVGGTVNITPGIWDSGGDILYAGATTNHFVNAPTFIETPLLDQIFSSNETFYYGIKYDYVSGQALLAFRLGLGIHTIYIWNNGTASWDVDPFDTNLYVYFKKYKKVHPVGWKDAFVGRKQAFFGGYTTLASSSLATTIMATAITPETIISGFLDEPTTITLLGDVTS